MGNITIKNMPRDDRPYEKCVKLGPQGLSDAELLSIIIRTGSKESNSLDLANKILALNYPDNGILGLLHHSLQEFMEIKGIGLVKGIQLQCIGELSRRIWKCRTSEEKVFDCALKVSEYYREDLRHLEQEEIHVMFFNTKQKLIKDILISRGTVNSSVVSPREIFIEAFRYHAVYVILVHNHPSGDIEPSREDIYLTSRVREAGNILGIQLIDHVIVGHKGFISFKERGLL